MSHILSIYSINAFKEYLLPAIWDGSHVLMIESDLFGLGKDIRLSLEAAGGQWRVNNFDEFSIAYINPQRPYQGEILKDSDIFRMSLGNHEQISVIVKERDDIFSVYRKYDLSGMREMTIGSNAGNTFRFNNMGLVSGHHATIRRSGNGFVIEDASGNGTFINGKRMQKTHSLQFGDCIDVFGFRIVYLGAFIAINSVAKNLIINESVLQEIVEYDLPNSFGGSKQKDKNLQMAEKILFHRSPRNIPKIDTEKIEIEAPPAPREIADQSLLLSIGPSLTMALPMLVGCLLSIYGTRASGGTSSAFMYTGLVTAVGSALIGMIWSIVNMRLAKKKGQAEEQRRSDAYGEYLNKRAAQIQRKYEHNTQCLRELYPDALHCSGYDRNSVELWNRNRRHEDFLSERLGIGALPFQADIDIPKERFSLVDDSLAERPKQIRAMYRYLQQVPICVDLLRHKLVGVIGGSGRKGCYAVMHDLAAQIAANNCYTDVKMIFIYDETKDAGRPAWEFARWLPHVWAEDKKTRFVAGNKADASDVFYEVAKVLRMRAEEKESIHGKSEEIAKPYYILFLENISLMEGELISKYVYDTTEDYGISTVVMVESYEDLPNACEYIIENTDSYQGAYNVDDGADDRIHIAFDAISAERLEDFARRLSSIEVKEEEVGGEIPSVLTFFDMYGVHHPQELGVLDRWKKNRTYDSMKALIGQKTGGVDCYLDVHEKYHGPHGLVAGTTGSGKSETLQTYMLSLAMNYSPDDIGFFVIDYKGGGMANLFEGLPHMIGQISNLSGNQVRRAMVSIKSENLRRQRIFNEHGVNNINLYTRLYKNNEATVPVPHMFIIIDEFAELKREEPDFMRELISVAQVGRSLGVHLILATQKPSGTVDDNIWSNSKFRLCLRVQDRQDSTDMLHKPDAAYITQAGRCYLQVGNDELFELFQSAWSGAVYDKNAGSVQTNIAQMLSVNGKAALVGSHAQIQQKEQMKRDWIVKLIDEIDQSAAGIDCKVKECVHDRGLGNRLTKAVFEKLEADGIEYPSSDYNSHRILDLLNVYGEILNWEMRPSSKEELAEAIVRRSDEERKKLPEMKEKTQLDAVVEYLAEVARENGYDHDLQLWLPVLPTELYLEELEGYGNHAFDGRQWPEAAGGYSLETAIGLLDDPENQSQIPMTLDVAIDGNHAIIGTVVSGKSTFLLTYLYSLIYHYSPDAVNVYILDYSSKMLGALENAPHIGGILYEEDDEKVSKFFTMLERMLDERKKLFHGGSYSQYIQANGLTIPSVVIAIDNMASFRSKTNDNYDDLLLSILKEGINYGIYIVATAAGFGMNEIPNRMGENFRSVICLEMNDKFAYTDALRTLHIDVLPEENVKGRGIAKVGDSILEFQTALPLRAEDDYQRTESIQKDCQTLRMAWNGKTARKIPEIPEKPVWSEFEQLDEVEAMAADGMRLPIGYDRKDASIYGIDLSRTYCYLVSGKARTGKSNVLRILIQSAAMAKGEVAVIDFGGDLAYASQAAGAEYIDTAEKMQAYFAAMVPKFQERNKVKKECSAKGLSSEEIYVRMRQFEAIHIILWDLPEFVLLADRPSDDIGSMSPFLTNLWDKGAYHNVFWYAAMDQDDRTKVLGYETFKLFTKDGNGIHLGGKVEDQQLLAFDHIPYNLRSKVYKPGIGLLPTHDEDDTDVVVLPLYRTEQ